MNLGSFFWRVQSTTSRVSSFGGGLHGFLIPLTVRSFFSVPIYFIFSSHVFFLQDVFSQPCWVSQKGVFFVSVCTTGVAIGLVHHFLMAHGKKTLMLELSCQLFEQGLLNLIVTCIQGYYNNNNEFCWNWVSASPCKVISLVLRWLCGSQGIKIQLLTNSKTLKSNC